MTVFGSGPALWVGGANLGEVREALESIFELEEANAVDLVRNIVNKCRDKFDEYVATDVLDQGLARKLVDLEAGKRAVERLLAG